MVVSAHSNSEELCSHSGVLHLASWLPEGEVVQGFPPRKEAVVLAHVLHPLLPATEEEGKLLVVPW